LSRRRIGLLAAAAGIVVVSAAACLLAPPFNSGSGVALHSSAVAAEYMGEVRNLEQRGLTLAPGWHWPQQAPPVETTGPDGAPMTYEKGFGVVRADRYWFYSWASRAVSTRNEAARKAAVQQLTRVRETLFYARRLPEDRAYTDQMLERAARGDMTMLRQYVVANVPTEGAQGDVPNVP
jgi:hypothetical protein